MSRLASHSITTIRSVSEGRRQVDYAVDVTMESAEQSDSTPY